MAEVSAKVAATDRRAEALGIDVQAAILTSRGSRALRALLMGDDDRAREALAELDDGQLQRLENAAVALSLHISRLREAS